MSFETLKRKLASRKFWAAVASVALAIGVLFGIDDLTMEHVLALITAVGGLSVYMFVEGNCDKASIETPAESIGVDQKAFAVGFDIDAD